MVDFLVNDSYYFFSAVLPPRLLVHTHTRVHTRAYTCAHTLTHTHARCGRDMEGEERGDMALQLATSSSKHPTHNAVSLSFICIIHKQLEDRNEGEATLQDV